MKIRVHHTIGDLEDAFRDIAKAAPRAEAAVVREGIKTGNQVAKDFARRSSGRHGKHYPKAFSPEMHGWRGGFGVGIISGEYGPDASLPQGNMEFEHGSRNQPPHHDLAKSADLIGGSFARETGEMAERLFLENGFR